MKYLASIVTIAFIYLLFRMARERGARPSYALWLPVLWLGIIASRPVSFWLNPNRGSDYVARFTESSPIDAATFGLLIVCGLLILNRRAARVAQLLRLNLPLLLFFFYSALSLSWSDDPRVGFKRWIKAVGDVVMVFLVLTEFDAEAAIRRLYARVGFVLLPLSVLFILYYPALGTTYDASEHVTMYTGVATFKNLLGVLCMACGLGAVWSFLSTWENRPSRERTLQLVAHGTAVLLAVGLVIRADSMTSFSSFALAGSVLAASFIPLVRRRPHLLIGVYLLAIAAAGFALFVSSGAGLLHGIGRNSTLTGRTMIWKAVLAQPINPLIGAGFESFWMGDRMQSVWSMSQVGIQQAHNGYLELYLNLGWIGLTLLGVVIVAGYRSAFALYRQNPRAGGLRIALITAGILYAFTEAGFRMMSPDWFGFLLAIVAMPAMMPARATTMPRKQSRKQELSEVRILQ